eukprot:CAMPEP_0183363622 /NCGR_PEP_ID=MMETSP0164_2-20130417/76075_1 /TAXON_ID=221442 /ORGANISM="Coccolithus pelagicus ssp braarudi, Strain PLY182g" /LENGTH=246 /DNA_ID=CAMNT_0025538761 /DNA_START=77 /DNA_END=813 /DNA_ORIENTATION=-
MWTRITHRPPQASAQLPSAHTTFTSLCDGRWTTLSHGCRGGTHGHLGGRVASAEGPARVVESHAQLARRACSRHLVVGILVEEPQPEAAQRGTHIVKVYLVVPIETLPMSSEWPDAGGLAGRLLLHAAHRQVVHGRRRAQRCPRARPGELVVREEAHVQAVSGLLAVRASRVQDPHGGLVGVGRGPLGEAHISQHERPAVLVGDVVPAQVELDQPSLDRRHDEVGHHAPLGRTHVDEAGVRRGADL